VCQNLLAIGLYALTLLLADDGQSKAPTTVQAERGPLGSHLANAAKVRAFFGLTSDYQDVAGIESLKIAILDYGFEGMDGKHVYLPANAVVVEHYDPAFIKRSHLGDPEYRNGFAPANSHGRRMAQIVWAVTGFHPGGPKFYLLNANGPTMFHRAVRYAVEAKVDIILFCNTFEGGGNGDGRGAINRIVHEATAADILWINAAGNYGGCVYNGPVELLPDRYLRLGAGPTDSALRFRNLLDENTVTITLTWNDYREEEDAGSNKDLDLYVEDWQGHRIGASEKKQVARNKVPGPEESRNPRERLVLQDLAASGNETYRIRIRAKETSFAPTDRIRVLISSTREVYADPDRGAATDAVQFLDATRKGEIFPPADHPLVLTVGDMSAISAKGPTEDHRVKPDVVLPESRAFFSNGEITSGASNAAAYFAGIVAVLRAAEPGLRTRHLLWFAHYAPVPERASPVRSTQLSRGRSMQVNERLPMPFADDQGQSEKKSAAFTTRIVTGRAPPIRERLPMPFADEQPRERTSPLSPPEDLVPATTLVRPGTPASSGSRIISGSPPIVQGRSWHTPTRQQLADEVRTDH
jgi:hypothetical protein